jgi:hypothetical protein
MLHCGEPGGMARQGIWCVCVVGGGGLPPSMKECVLGQCYRRQVVGTDRGAQEIGTPFFIYCNWNGAW